jgi:hypothetical protein
MFVNQKGVHNSAGRVMSHRHQTFVSIQTVLFDFYESMSPNSLRVIRVVSDIVCSVTQYVTCDGASLRIIFKLPLLEAEDSSPRQMLLIP